MGPKPYKLFPDGYTPEDNNIADVGPALIFKNLVPVGTILKS